MQKRKPSAKYLLPAAFAVILVALLVFGILFMRDSLMKLTVQERSAQLEEMVTQIQANLVSGLQTHWNLTEGLNNAVQGRHFENKQELCGEIAALERVFGTELYGSRVMLLDAQGTAYLRDGSAGIWNDVSHLIDGERGTPLSRRPTASTAAFWCSPGSWIPPSRWGRRPCASPTSCCLRISAQ